MKLAASSVGFCIGGKTILDGVDLHIGEGELIGLIGPNGSGKTTLLRIMAGLLPPAGGTVSCDGRPLGQWDIVELARTIAYLSQEATVHWSLSVEQLVALGRLPHRRSSAGRERDEIAVNQAMAATGIADLRHRTADTLSGGERMRVMLARALAVEAPMLLVDEPVAALDPFHQLQAMEVLKATAKTGAAVAVVLHDLSLASRFCDRLLLLHRGKTAATGLPEEVLTEANLSRAYNISTLRGRHRDQNFVLPWDRN